MDLISRSYKVLGYDGPIPEGFTLNWIEPHAGYIVVAFEKVVPIPESTSDERTLLRHFINANGTVVVKFTEVYESLGRQ